ncbi:MAG: DUF4091 domain-containing protein [Clostridia bacterium]|nr:DUF4091 domain-containing protein [Clostridia bacterium]
MLQTIVLSSLTKVFLDEAPKDEKFSCFSLLQNEYGAFQIALKSDEKIELKIKIESDLDVSCFEVKNIPAKKVCSTGDEYYLRKESGLFPDLLCDCDKIIADENYRSLWFEIKTNKENCGNYPVKIQLLNSEKIVSENTVTVEVIGAELPEQSLVCTNWFHTDCIHTYYDVPVFSEEYWRITENFARAAVEHGINLLLTPLFTPPLDTAVGKERPTVQLVDVTVENGEYSFGFSKLQRWIEMCNRCGVKYFEMNHLFTQWGAMHTPKIMATVDGKYKQLFGWKTWAASKKYTEFLTAFSKELIAFLKAEGVEKRCYFHVSDEPSMERIRDYGKRSALIKELFGEFPIIDALSDFDFYKKGIIKNPIPCINSAEKFYGNVPELWTYYCCGPDKDFYPNRFFGMPLQRTRVLGYQLYKYDIKGFLQWGLNFWYSQLSDHPINPFETSDSDGAFPAGDAFVLYPGEGGKALASIRFKAFREAFQDQRALQLLEKLAGREEALKILQNDGEIKFNEYPHSSEWQLKKREEINSAIKNLIK